MEFNFLSGQVGQPILARAVSQPSQTGGAASGVYAAVIRWLVYGLAFLLPLFFLPWTADVLENNKQMLLMVVAAVGLITWLVSIVVSGSIRFRFHPLAAGIGALTVVALLLTLLTGIDAMTFFGATFQVSTAAATMVSLAVLYILAIQVMHEKGNRVLEVVAVSFLIALLYGFLQLVGWLVPWLPEFTQTRSFNTLGSVFMLGAAAAMLLPVYLKLRLTLPRMGWFNFAWIGAGVSLALLVVLNSPVLWAIAVAGMLGLIVFDSVTARAASRGGKSNWTRHLIGPMVVIVVGVFLLLVQFSVPSVQRALPTAAQPSYALSWQTLKGALGDNFISGFGPGHFADAFDRFGAAGLSNSLLADARYFTGTSQVITWVIEGGVLAILGLGVLFALWGWHLWTFSRQDEHTNLSAGGALFGLHFGLIVALFLVSFSVSLLWLWLCALICLALAGQHTREWKVSIEQHPSWAIGTSVGFVAVLIVVLITIYTAAGRYTASALFARSSRLTEHAAALTDLSRALAWDENNPAYLIVASRRTLELFFQDVAASQGAQGEDLSARLDAEMRAAIQFATQATTAAPQDVTTWLNLAQIYQQLIGFLQDADVQAQQAYDRASQLRPGDPTISARIGIMRLNRADQLRQVARSAGSNGQQFNDLADQDLALAEQSLRKAIELSPNYGLAIYNLGIVYDRQGNLNEAIKQIERILPANLNQPGLIFELGLLYGRNNRKDDSLIALQRAVALNSQFANARWYLGLLYQERHEWDFAIEQFEKILETNPGNETVLNKLQEVRDGKVSVPAERAIDQEPI